MKHFFTLLLLFSSYSRISAQPLPESYKVLYNGAKADSEKGKCLTTYLSITRDDSLFFKNTLELLNYFKNNNDQVGQDYVQLAVSDRLSRIGDYTTALSQSLQILTRFENRRDDYGIMTTNKRISIALYYSGDIEQALLYDKKVLSIALRIGDKTALASAYNNLGSDYTENDMPDSGLIYARLAVKLGFEINDTLALSISLGTLGENYIARKEYDIALPLIRKAYSFSKVSNQHLGTAWALNNFAEIFLAKNHLDSAIYYAQQAVVLSTAKRFQDQQLRGYEYLYRSYEKMDTRDSVYKYFRLSINTKDSLFSAQKARQVQAINFREQIRQQDFEKDKIEQENKIRTYALVSGLAIFSIIVFILFRNNRQKQKSNKVLQTTLSDLRSTQSQLIQSEKMASLGELTAGIAHEIQNPLNFVNNFSEVSSELADELKDAVAKNDSKEAIAIADDIKQNLNKITIHGKRADAIVKGMLQHSRSSSGKKEPTDINALTDEYLRLSYHGLRAKDKSFNATMETHYDESLEKVNVISQDIGRVILNLFTNAFYSVAEKNKMLKESQLPDYTPTVSLTTKKVKDKVEIIVSDNGSGIPQKVLDKIYQPFFTTKPTGQGTGLGLSLSYDIIKAHGGELRVETKEGQFAKFIITLPMN